MDFDRSVLMKLRRVLPRTEIVNTEIVNKEGSQSALFKTGEDPELRLELLRVSNPNSTRIRVESRCFLSQVSTKGGTYS